MSEDLAALEEQRDILLKSLRDLEQERAAGEVADDDYAVLKDDYTARAAAVLRTIEAQRSRGARRPARRRQGGARRRPPGLRAGAGAGAGGAPAPGTRPARARPAPRRAGATRGPKNQPVPRRQRTLAISIGVAFAIVAVAGMSVVLFAGGRNPGQPVTGSVPGDTAAASRVDDALALENDGNAVEALQLYDEILADEPDNVEALAYRGWLLKRAGLPDQALVSLDRAVAVDPTFADAHFFRGMVLLQDRDDPAGAVVEFQAFLANNPPPDFVDAVGQVLAQAQAAAAAKANGTTTTVAP
ncbi:MAG: hypothetical protein QOG43_652 [Actinomycetota bacterium]|jgi:tetratricopeptide (TPR) repeat protein|nr:hypothetical protein [Actinomycetota bacterium]